MSKINTFLQKRKMHENRHVVFMVIIAYVLSFLMLFFGSDVFYNIKSTASGIMNESEEAAQEQIEEEELSELLDEIRANKLLLKYQSLEEISSSQEILSKGEPLETRILTVPSSTDSIDQYPSLQEQEGENTDFDKQIMKEKSEQDTDEDVDMIQSFSVVSEEMKTEDKKEKKKSKEKENQEKVEEVSNPGYIIKVTDEEVAMLERIVQAEAGSEDIKGRILVANVILNRVANEDFPDTIKEVIFQNSNGDYQFSPVSDKRYWSVKVTKNTKESVERALKGEDYSEGALYFMARKRAKKNSAQWFDNNLTWLFQHGGHEFYK